MSEKQSPFESAQVPSTVTRANTELVPGRGLVPRTLDDLYRMSVAFCASGLMPNGMNTPEQVMVACQMGMEMGLSMMQSVQNIAVINGRPSLWGDMPLALVEQSGKLETFEEWFEGEGEDMVAVCQSTRKGGRSIERRWSWRDAVKAKLTGKNTWQQYPKRMCQMRARSWVLKDLYPDVIKGVAIAEYNDYTTGHDAAGAPIDVTPAAPAEPSVQDLMGSAPEKAAGGEPQLTHSEKEIADEIHEKVNQVMDQNSEPTRPPAAGKIEQDYYQGLADMGYDMDQIHVFKAFNDAYLELDPDMDREKHFARAVANWDQHLKSAVNWSKSEVNDLGLDIDASIGAVEDLDLDAAGGEPGGDDPPPHPGEDESADQAPEVDVAAANDTKRWIAMRASKDPSAGFAGYVLANREAFRQADSDVKQKAAKKWKNICRSKPPWENDLEYVGCKPVPGTGAGAKSGGEPKDLVEEVASMSDDELDGGVDPAADARMQEEAAVADALKTYQYGAKKHIVMQAAKELKMGTSPMTADGKRVLLERCQEIEAKLIEVENAKY